MEAISQFQKIAPKSGTELEITSAKIAPLLGIGPLDKPPTPEPNGCGVSLELISETIFIFGLKAEVFWCGGKSCGTTDDGFCESVSIITFYFITYAKT